MRATTRSTPNVSRATRAEMMFELSPEDTAANADGLLDARPQQHVAVESHAQHAFAGELGAEPVERRAVTVDDGDIVADPGQAVGQRCADPAASHHHYSHLRGPFGCSSKLPSSNLRTAERYSQTASGLTLGSRVQAFDRRAAAGPGQAVPQRQAGAHPAAEADRPAGVRLRRAVVGGVRARGDLPGAVGGRPGRVLDGAVDRARRRRR